MIDFGAMAQWLERTAYNREVLGSIPNSPTMGLKRLKKMAPSEGIAPST